MDLDEEMKKEIQRVDNLALVSVREIEQAGTSPGRDYLRRILKVLMPRIVG